VWKLGNVRRVLYRLPEVIAAVSAGDTVYIAEGEKDVEALRAAQCVATCNVGGANNWRPEYAETLAGASVVVVRDRDEPGTAWARQVFGSVRPVAASIRVVEARAGKDAADHLAAGHTVDDFVPVWPAADLRATDPGAWKAKALREGLSAAEPIELLDAEAERERSTGHRFPTGLGGYTMHKLAHLQGVVVVAGLPSSGKSLLAAAAAFDAAKSGAEVVYISCEMPGPVLYERLHRLAAGGALPESFRVLDVTFGVTLDALVERVAAFCTGKPMLVVFDSVSSFVDQVEQHGKDEHGLALLKRVVMWAINARRATDGEIGFILLAEASKEGRARGRFADHKADMAILMESQRDNRDIKCVTLTKAWGQEVGEIGDFRMHAETGRLQRV